PRQADRPGRDPGHPHEPGPAPGRPQGAEHVRRPPRPRRGLRVLRLRSPPMRAIDAGPVDVAVLDDTIGQNLAGTVAAHGDSDALVSGHQGRRGGDRGLAERVETLAGGLLGLGLATGDRVGLWSPNYAEWTLLQYATAEIGVILVNVNPAYRAHELAYVL